jgi:hypothetical protein
MTLHGALSIILNIKKGMKGKLIELLQEIDRDVNNNSRVPFSAIGSIHFARFLVCDADADPRGIPILDRLVFTTNYDQPVTDHIDEVIEHAGPGLWQIFNFCDGFETGNYDAQKLKAFLYHNNKKSETFYVGVGYRSVLQIKQENQLRNEVQNYLDANRKILIQQDEVSIRNNIINHIFSQPGFEWAKTPVPPASFGRKLLQGFKIGLAIISFLIFLPVIIPFLLVWMLIILRIEISETDINCPTNKEHIRALTDREKGVVQNQFSAVGNVKPGWVRYQTMMFLLRLTNFLAPYLFSKGKLSGIPTVHFARWLIINEGRQMVFLSNYDGNSEGYLRDFIHIAGKQLTLMFTHTIGYPKTRLMIFGGAKDARGFMQWAREKQVITNVWYSANPTVTVVNIFHNAAIRNGLYGKMSPKKSAAWLQLL